MIVYYNYLYDCTYGSHNQNVEPKFTAVDAAAMQPEILELIFTDIFVEEEAELLF